MTPVAIGLGSSFGDPRRTLRMAVHLLEATPGLRIRRNSRIVSSPPAGGIAARTFLNAVVLAETTLPVLDLLDRCKAIEARLGRRPTRRWADRVLDIDLLLYGNAPFAHPRITVPHPRLAERDFVLQPLAEVWPDAQDPATHLRYRDTHPVRRPLPIVGTLPQPSRAGPS